MLGDQREETAPGGYVHAENEDNNSVDLHEEDNSDHDDDRGPIREVRQAEEADGPNLIPDRRDSARDGDRFEENAVVVQCLAGQDQQADGEDNPGKRLESEVAREE